MVKNMKKSTLLLVLLAFSAMAFAQVSQTAKDALMNQPPQNISFADTGVKA